MKPGLQSYGKNVTRKTSKNHLKRTFVYILTPFVNIVNLFERNISKQDTIFRMEIPVEKRVAVAFRQLETHIEVLVRHLVSRNLLLLVWPMTFVKNFHRIQQISLNFRLLEKKVPKESVNLRSIAAVKFRRL